MSQALPPLSWVDPHSLLTPRRLDYLVKRRLFLHYLRGGDPGAEPLYRWHIEARTGGVEPRSSKRRVEDYLVAARALLRSIGRHGFDPAFAVQLAPDGLIRRGGGTGAHRIACCLALRVPIAVRRCAGSSGRETWGFSWFAERGLPGPDLVWLAQEWVRVSRTAEEAA